MVTLMRYARRTGKPTATDKIPEDVDAITESQSKSVAAAQ